MTIIKVADGDDPADTLDCAELTEVSDESDTWTVTLHVPDGVASKGDYATDIIVEADDSHQLTEGQDEADHGTPC